MRQHRFLFYSTSEVVNVGADNSMGRMDLEYAVIRLELYGVFEVHDDGPHPARS